jgi:RNA polymerase sigma factor (sigma-70 family)
MPTTAEPDVDLRTRVRAALAQLPADQRQVIELTLVAGLTQRAIAAHLHCPEADVPRLAHLALQTVHELINRPVRKTGE